MVVAPSYPLHGSITCHRVKRYFCSANQRFVPPSGCFAVTVSRPLVPALINGLVEPQHIATSRFKPCQSGIDTLYIK